MQIYSKLLKPILEVKYLSSENVERYRVIIRYFFNEYENIKYSLYKEEIYQMMIATKHFSDYTLEKCQNDLDALSQWGNLIAYQDTSKVTTIEAYRNKRYRYQLSEYTVEIERMILHLENLEIEGASLEPSLLERLQQQLLELPTIISTTDMEVNSWWKSINNDFIRLNQNYQDYIRTLNSHKSEEMMKSEEFLMFKDNLIAYLRTFVKGLQEFGSLISIFLQKITKEDVDQMIKMVVNHEMSIPRMDKPRSKEEIENSIIKRWININDWFVGNGVDNELNRFYDITNDIIRKITRYAQQIGEMKHRNSNRKEEYRHIANLFGKCQSLHEAHNMSASVFGVEKPFHMIDLDVRKTDDIDSNVYDEEATIIEIEPRTRIARKSSPRNSIEDTMLEQKMYRLELEAKQERDKKLLYSYMKDGKIVFSDLPRIDDYTRKMLLSWITKALQHTTKKSKTDFGLEYRVDITNAKHKCTVICDDGIFTMPQYTISFQGDK